MTTLTTRPVPVTSVRSLAPQGFEVNPARGRFNSAFFSVTGGYINWHMHQRKAKAFADLSANVVELGSGVGANLRYLPSGARLIAIEPNPYMHARLRRAARRRGVELEIRSVVGERIDLPAPAPKPSSPAWSCARSATRPRSWPRSAGSCDQEDGSASPSTSPRNRARRHAGHSGSCVTRGRGSSRAAPANATWRA